MGELVVLNYDGAKTIVWDPDEVHQIKTAERQFNALIEKGFSALKIKSDREEGLPVDRFDSRADKILMFPILSGG